MKKLTILITMLMATSPWATENSDLGLDKQTYLACEAGKKEARSYKPWGYTIKDLLENKIDLKLNKKKKKNIKKRFGQELRWTRDPIPTLIPINYIDKKFDFIAFRILDKADKDNTKTICKSSNKHLDVFSECKAYAQLTGAYHWRSRNWKSCDYCTADAIHRDTLIYKDQWKTIGFAKDREGNHVTITKTNHYQCYVSNLDEINKLAANYKGYIKPFEEEWERHLSEFRLKIRLDKEAREAKNKI